MNEYFLQSDRLGFQRWSVADKERAISLWGDTNVNRYIGGPFTPDQIQARLQHEIDLFQKYGVQYWPIFLLANNGFIGCCGLRPYEIDEQVYELGFHICPMYWHQGYAQEAAQAVIHYAFNVIKVSALFAGHNPANLVSQHLLTKLGFEYTHDEHYPPTDLQHPSYWLTAENFHPMGKQ